ncbi:MAG: hypothetical protein IJ767_04600 [Bacteroidaceae bacterium]|nr:hypothetical protein [Bacteroidaceae bacterium]MBR1800759.1 hypothetical protein [Bacteroidaceae bacterium]
MKKISFFQLFTFIVVAVFAVSFVSCSKDDSSDSDNDRGSSNANANGLVGTWRRIHKYEIEYTQQNGEWVKANEEEKNYEPDVASHGLIINADGSAQEIYVKGDGTYDQDEKPDMFKWKTENNHLYLMEDEEGDTDGWEDWGAYKLSGSKLEITSDGLGHKGTYKEHTVMRYQKL